MTTTSPLACTLDALRSVLQVPAGRPWHDSTTDLRVTFASDDAAGLLHNALAGMRTGCTSWTPQLPVCSERESSAPTDALCRGCCWDEVMMGDFLAPETSAELVALARPVRDWLDDPSAPRDLAACRSMLTAAHRLLGTWAAFGPLHEEAERTVAALLEDQCRRGPLLRELCDEAAAAARSHLDEHAEEISGLDLEELVNPTELHHALALRDARRTGWALVEVVPMRRLDLVTRLLLETTRLVSRNGFIHLLPACALGPLGMLRPGGHAVVGTPVISSTRPSPAVLEALGVLYDPHGDGAFTTLESTLAAAELL